jgi:hypothetical protein
MKLADIVGVLPQMVRSDLWKLKITIDEMLKDDDKDSSEIDLFYGAITSELSSEGIKVLYGKKDANYRNYKKRFPMVTRFIEQECKNLDKVQRIRFYHILVQAIIKQLEDLGLPKTVNMISNQFSNIYPIMENSFPGYLKSGLIDRLVRYEN